MPPSATGRCTGSSGSMVLERPPFCSPPSCSRWTSERSTDGSGACEPELEQRTVSVAPTAIPPTTDSSEQ